MLSNATKAHAIVELIRREVRSQTDKYISAKADLARAETGREMEEKENERQGYMRSAWSQDSYNVERHTKLVTSTYSELRDREAVLEYAIKVFIDMIPDESENVE